MHLHITSSVQSSCREFGVEIGPEQGTECEPATRHLGVAERPQTLHKVHRAKVQPGTHACFPSPGRLDKRLLLSNLPSTDIPSRRAQHPSTRHSLKHCQTLPKQTSTPRNRLTVSQTRKQADPTSRIQTFRRSRRPERS